MLLPCYETYKRMVGAHAGLWPELVNDGSRIELAVKLGAHLAKAILKGAPVTLVIAVVQISEKSVRVVGLKIEDDKNDPAFLQQPQETLREQQLFDALLAKDCSWLTFFDELVRPVLSARVVWNKGEASKAIAELQRTSPHYQGNSMPLLAEAMARALDDCGKWHRGEGKPEPFPSYEWWIAFAERVRPELEANSNLKLTSLSEMATLGEIRANHTLALVIEFVKGKSVGFIDPDNPNGIGE